MRSLISALILTSIAAAAWWALNDPMLKSRSHSSKSTLRSAPTFGTGDHTAHLVDRGESRLGPPILTQRAQKRKTPPSSFAELASSLKASEFDREIGAENVGSIVQTTSTPQLLDWSAKAPKGQGNLWLAGIVGDELLARGSSLELLKLLPPGEIRAAVASPSLESAAQETPERVASFLNSLENTQDLHSSIALIAHRYAEQDLTAALEWVDTIQCDQTAEHTLDSLQLLVTE